jgi:hypothetical protein
MSQFCGVSDGSCREMAMTCNMSLPENCMSSFSLQLYNQSVCDLRVSWITSGTKNSGCLLSVATVRVQYKNLSRMILIG